MNNERKKATNVKRSRGYITDLKSRDYLNNW